MKQHPLVVYWNTKCSYTPYGQRITGAYTENGHIIFCDHDRKISGVITRDGKPRVFHIEEVETTRKLQCEIEINYRQAYNYQYDVLGLADKLPIDPHDSTHGFKLPK